MSSDPPFGCSSSSGPIGGLWLQLLFPTLIVIRNFGWKQQTSQHEQSGRQCEHAL